MSEKVQFVGDHIGIIDLPMAVDYRSFVDPDVARMYEGNRTYLSWEPLIAQLIAQLRKDAVERWEDRQRKAREPQSREGEK